MRSPHSIVSLAIDTIRTITPKKSLKSLETLSQNSWIFLQNFQTQPLVLLNQLQRKEYRGKIKTNRATQIRLLKLDNNNQASSYLVAKSTQELNIQSDYMKTELSINGLAQPQPTSKATYRLINQSFKNLTLSTIDLCIDVNAPLPSINALKVFCDNRFICTYKNSIYLNKPSLQGVKRIVLYNKALKAGIAGTITRAEFTCEVNQKLKAFIPPYNQIYDFIKSVFNEQFEVTSYNKQIKLLTDKRSFNQRIKLLVFLLWMPLIANFTIQTYN